VLCKRRGADTEIQRLAHRDRPVLGDLVGDVDQADRAEGEARICHQREVQRKREQVRSASRQCLARREAAHLGVVGQARGTDARIAKHQLDVRDLTAASADERQERCAGHGRCGGAQVQREDPGGAL
jgi:hypothetical protein